MKKTKILLGTLIIVLLVASCVSKRKYDELESAKRKSDRMVRNLKKDKTEMMQKIKKMTNDYNTLKNDMAKNNAEKDKQIDKVSSQVYGLTSDQDALKEELETTNEKYNNVFQESRRKEKKIAELTNQLERYKRDLTDTKSMVDNVQTKSTENINTLNKKIKTLEKEIQISEAKINRLHKENGKLKITINQLKSNVKPAENKVNDAVKE